MGNLKFKRLILVLGIFSPIYFFCLAYYNLNKLHYAAINVLGELLTIPMILLTLIILIISLINWIKVDTLKLGSSYLLSLVLSTTTLLVLFFLK
jgi:hypothetical protein